MDYGNFGRLLKTYNDSEDVKEVGNLLNKFHNIIRDDITTRTIDLICFEIFNDSFSLIDFFNAKIDQKRWKDAYINGLSLLQDLFKNFYNALKIYRGQVLLTCTKLFHSNLDCYVKNKSLELASLIVKEDSDCSLNTEVETIYKHLFAFISISNDKRSTTVLEHVFSFLGVIALKYPLFVKNESDLITCYLTHLQNEVIRKKIHTLKGLLYGFSDILKVFPIDDSNSRECKKIYKLIKDTFNIVQPNNQTHKTAAAHFIINHSSILIKYMYEDVRTWHNLYLNWLSSENEHRKKAYILLDVFYQDIANILKANENEKDKETFYYFYNYFVTTMNEKQNDRDHFRTAIRGYGMFAGACKTHVSNEEVILMFYAIVHKVESKYFIEENINSDEVELLPDYIQCISTIMHCLEEINTDQIIILQQLSILMIQKFPKLSTHYHMYVSNSLILTMCSLVNRSEALLDNYLQRVVYQGVLWTCSHKMALDLEIASSGEDHEGNSVHFTYKNFLPLWLHIVQLNRFSNQKYNYPAKVLLAVTNSFFNELMKSLFLLINKLNFNVKLKNSNMPVTDLESGYEAVKEDDLVMFVNAVDFYKDIILKCDIKMFKKWIKSFIKWVIIKSTHHPLISGFYKLLAVCFKMSVKLKYFDETQLSKETVQSSFQLTVQFIEKLLPKVQYYKGDLQLSCVQLVLALPVTIVKCLLPGLPAVLQIVFTIGRNNLQLAEDGLNTLEEWMKVLPAAEMQHLFEPVLPYFDSFLLSKSFSGDHDIKIPLLEERKMKHNKPKRKVFVEEESQLFTVQKKILMFIGQLKSETCVYVVDSNKQVDQVAWINKPILKFGVPFVDAKPDIYLDKILPRVIELATCSSNLQTKTNACELLHAIVIFTVGLSRQSSGTMLNELGKVFQTVARPLLELASDSLMNVLFSKLFFQLIHWYTSPTQLASQETSIIIETLLDGVCHPTNTAIKDFSGKCIKEFIQWTISQLSSKDLENFPYNIKAMVSQICMLCTHPDANKRLGAALAFNNMYVQLREEEVLVNMFWIELLHSFVISLSFESSDEIENKQILYALDHIERVFKEMSDVFNEVNTNRRVPSEIHGTTLKDVVSWILLKTASPNKACRHKCRLLVKSLAPCVSNCSTIQDYMAHYIQAQDDKWFLEFYEKNSIRNMPIPCHKSENDAGVVIEWLRNLLCCTDNYLWLLQEDIIKFNDLISEQGNFTESLNHFIAFTSVQKLTDAVLLLSEDNKNLICSPPDVNQYNNLKCSILLSMIDLLRISLKHGVDCSVFFSDGLWNVMCLCIFSPHSVHFDFNNQEIMDALHEKMVAFLNAFMEKSPENICQIVCDAISNYFISHLKDYPPTEVNIPLEQRLLLKGWCLIIQSHISGKFEKNFAIFNIEKIFNDLVIDDGEKRGIYLKSSIQEYTGLKIKLAFSLQDSVPLLCECLLNQTPVRHPETHALLTHGEFFLNTFKDAIIDYLIKSIIDVAHQLSLNVSHVSANLLVCLLKKIYEDGKCKSDTLEIVSSITRDWETFFDNTQYSSFSDRLIQCELLLSIMRILNEPLYKLGERNDFIESWFCNNLIYKDDVVPKKLFQYKMKVLNCVSCITGPEDEDKSNLKNHLRIFQSEFTHFDKSTTWDEFDVIVMLNKYFDCLTLSKSKIVLRCICEFLMSVKSFEANINMAKKIKSYFAKLNAKQQQKSVNVIYTLCCDSMYDGNMRIKLAKLIFPAIIKNITNSTFENFYVEHIRKIINILQIEINSETQTEIFIEKTINFMLVELLFSRIDRSKFLDRTCCITKAAFDEITTDYELGETLTDIAISFSKTRVVFEDCKIQELNRICHCSAYNAAMSIIANCNYAVVFSDGIWENIIDCSKTIEIPQSFNDLPKRKTFFVNIRNEHQNKMKEDIRYLESQSLFNSTLSEDVSKFDFTSTLLRKDETNLEETETVHVPVADLQLHSVDMNDHECMATLCAFIQHMSDLNLISTKNNEVTFPWIERMGCLLIDEEVACNIKIFLVRIIINMQNVFKNFAMCLTEPLMKVITDRTIGDNINYFTADLISMLIDWSNENVLCKVKTHVNKVIAFLTENVHNDIRNVFKFNLELIKTAVQIWKSILEVPSNILILQLNHRPLAGIQLTAIFLANNLSPWTRENKNEYLGALLKLLKDTKHEVYKSTSEVLGMALKYAEETQQIILHEKLLAYVKIQLRDMEDGKFFHALDHMQNHYPKIIDDYIMEMCLKLTKQSESSLKFLGLRILLRRIKTNARAILLDSKSYNNFLNDQNRNVQLGTLHIIREMVGNMSPDSLIPILNTIYNFKTNTDSAVRQAMYQVLMSVFEQFAGKAVGNECKSVLLSGLIDPDMEIQKMIEQFWLDGDYLPPSLSERYLELLRNFYSPNTEMIYLGYSINFILEGCKQTPDYKNKLFDYELSDDYSYEDHKFLVQWRAQHLSLVPMFVNTYTNEQTKSNVPELIGVRMDKTFKQFDPTQTGLSLQSVPQYSTSLLFDSSFMIPSSSRNDADSDQSERKKSQSVNTQHYNRYLSDKAKTKKYYALREVARQNKISELQKNKKRIKEANIKLCRQYRTGDFPDITIYKSDVITLLQTLAKRDSAIARLLYVMLFNGLICTKEDKMDYLKQFGICANEIFNQTSMFVPSTIGALLDISYENQSHAYIEPELLLSLSKNCGLLSVGCLILEERIMSEDEGPSSSKRGCGSASEGIDSWIHLASLYKEMNEWDVVTGIFSEKLQCSDEIVRGIHEEESCHWKEALKYYTNLVEKDTSASRKQMYYESCFRCYANLSDWSQLSKDIKQNTDFRDIWDGGWNQNILLPWLMKTEMFLLSDNESNPISSQLKSWLGDPVKLEYMTDKFSEELAYMALRKNDMNAAKNYIHHYFLQFLEDFSNINPLFYKSRRNKLSELQKIVDMNKFIQFTDRVNQTNYNDLFFDITHDWQKNSDFTSFEMSISELRTIYRKQAITSLEHSITNFAAEQLPDHLKILNNLKFTADLSLIDTSLKERNYHVAKKYFQKNVSAMKNTDSTQAFQMNIALGKIGCFLADQEIGNLKYNKLVNSLRKLDSSFKNISNSDCCDLMIESSLEIFEISRKICKELENNSALDSQILQDILKHQVESPTEVQAYGKQLLERTVNMAESKCAEGAAHYRSLVKPYMCLVAFIESQTDRDNYNFEYVRYVLRAMKHGSDDARQLFPCLLQLTGLESDAIELFGAETSEIPVWMFLAWIPQLLANLNSELGAAVSAIIKRIVTLYPQSIMYDYRLSREQNKNEEHNEFISQCDHLLKNPVVEDLLSALSFLCIPETRVLFHLDRLIRSCQDIHKFKAHLETVSEDVLSYNSSQSMQGNLYRNSGIFQRFCKSIQKIMSMTSDELKAKGGVQLPKLKIDFTSQKESILTHVRATRHKSNDYLKNYSVWLANFKSLHYDYEIEIPGQYKGDKQPFPQYHAKLSSFLPKVYIFKSKWKPMKVTILGNNAREYPFIVKFGEDLRQDQRIQQLCVLANKILTKDKQCRQRNLSVETYEVVPLTSKIGLIECVCNCKDLGEFITESIGDRETLKNYMNVPSKYINMIKSVSGGRGSRDEPLHESYGRACAHLPRELVVPRFRELVNEVPWDVLRTCFRRLSVDIDSFMSLRSRFVTSYSAMCIVHYLLGIGDRHLSNILVRQDTGRAVGIDFGHAFGSATQELLVPELTPFRLTPHIVSLMEPFREAGPMQRSMVHCLRALRQHRRALLATMSVFMQEPTLDWQRAAQADGAAASAATWDPQQRLARATMKLEGASPVWVMRAELGCCPISADFKRAYVQVLEGGEGDMRHVDPAPTGLSVERQVACLIDQATDPNILGRMFHGLSSWV